MTEYQCRWVSTDCVKARGVGDSVHIYGYENNDVVSNVALLVDDARAFARGILALADEIDGGEDRAAQDVAVGDRVAIVREWSTGTGRDDGKMGTLVQFDPDDDNFPWLVELDSADRRTVWVHEVQRKRERAEDPNEAPAPSVAPDRVALLEEARRLVGSHDIGQLLNVARFLAGE
ncbi:hypothetical protein [Streptomyces asiaticus]|uniref:hypothetical protein n=1 Tax=Streptomyces asiaticus TaxID=114695 RepID=UPI001BA6A178|nr:hypothetical protein [Streptomyces asiaticus]